MLNLKVVKNLLSKHNITIKHKTIYSATMYSKITLYNYNKKHNVQESDKKRQSASAININIVNNQCSYYILEYFRKIPNLLN